MGGNGNRSAGSKTADEFMAEIEKDPKYAAGMKKAEDNIRRNIENYRISARGLVADLAAAGFEVDGARDLLRSGKYPANLVPILVRWLPLVQYDALKEDIVRTLSVPWARAAAPALIAEFERAALDQPLGLGWAIGNALEVVANDAITVDMLRLATDRRYGTARQMLVRGLGRLKDPHVIDVLIDLLADEDVFGHAVVALGKLRARAARPHLEPLLRHKSATVRNAAKTALGRIDKATV